MFSNEHDDICRGCVLWKYAKATFSPSKNRVEGVLGLIHSDICGPMSTRALSGGEYFIAFIDDHSRKPWIYFLKTKDEVFDRSRQFKVLIENITVKTIKVLRSDNGGEYTKRDFTDFCAKEGIEREWTIPYNLEKNGVVEQKTITIVGAAKAMFYDQYLPRYLWKEAWNTIVYIQNRIPHRELWKKMLEGVFIGKTP